MLYVRECGVKNSCKNCGRKKPEVKLYKFTKRENSKKTICLCNDCISKTLKNIIEFVDRNQNEWLSDLLNPDSSE